MNAKRSSNIELKWFGNSEKGAVSVLAIMVLLLLTIAGIASLYTARTEIQIAGNERDYVSALTYSDAGLNEVSQWFTNQSLSLPEDGDEDWIVPGVRDNCYSCSGACTSCTDSCDPGKSDAEKRICDILNFDPDTDTNLTITGSSVDPDTYYSVLSLGIALGSSLDITQTKPLLEYTLYGYYNKSLGANSSIRSLVEAGYRNR